MYEFSASPALPNLLSDAEDVTLPAELRSGTDSILGQHPKPSCRLREPSPVWWALSHHIIRKLE